MRFLELFAGIGGVSLGWHTAFSPEQLAASGLVSVEYHQKNLKCSQYWKRTHKEMQPLWGRQEYLIMPVEAYHPNEGEHFDWVHASPPCNTASVVNSLGESENDITIARSIAEILFRVRPEVFTLENVRGYKKYVSYGLILSALHGYHIQEIMVDASEWGVPQKRSRLCLVATKHPISPISPPGIEVKWEDVIDEVEEGDYLEGKGRSGKLVRGMGEPLWTLTCAQFHDQKYAARRNAIALRDREGNMRRNLTISEIGRLGGFNNLPESPKKWTFLGRAVGQSVPPPIIQGIALQLRPIFY